MLETRGLLTHNKGKSTNACWKRKIKFLDDNGKDPKKFWSTIKSVTSKGSVHNTITSDEWLHHFYEVFFLCILLYKLDYNDVKTSADDSITNEIDVERNGVPDILADD